MKRFAKTHIAKQLSRFPVALNVREFSELQTPDEVFRRHANRIGVSDMGEKLIGAWKADQVVLLIDGFDEIVPRSTVKEYATTKGYSISGPASCSTSSTRESTKYAYRYYWSTTLFFLWRRDA